MRSARVRTPDSGTVLSGRADTPQTGSVTGLLQGEHQIWSRDGKELFYRNGRKWMSVAVNLKPEFVAEKLRLLFEGPYVMIGGQSYDVAPDGQRFLVLEPIEQEPVTHLNVVLNWFEEVKQKAGHASAPR